MVEESVPPPSEETNEGNGKKDRVFLIVFSVYVALLVIATIGELFDIDAILNIFDLKKLFSV